MKLHASGEDYLETILLLSRKRGSVRSIDIAEELGFSKPSVSIAMKKLRDSELIHVNDDGYITLTQKGIDSAESVYERHSVLFDWLMRLGVSEPTAAADACRMEHIIHQETFEAIRRQLKN